MTFTCWADDKDTKEEFQTFFKDVIGIVEANSYESMMLWKENCQGLFDYAGWIDKRPICISMINAVIDGHKVLFYDACSRLVDHEMVDEYFKKHLPKSARQPNGEYINHTNAMNFYNIFRYVKS